MDSSVFKSYIYVQSEEDGGGREGGRGCYKYAVIVQIFIFAIVIIYRCQSCTFFFETVTNNKKGGKNRIFF